MAEAKKTTTGKKPSTKAKVSGKVVKKTEKTASKTTKSTKARVAKSVELQEESAEHKEAYKSTVIEHSKDATKQDTDSTISVNSSADEQDSTIRESGTAKAGKRSAKAIKETEEKLAKEERKADAKETTEQPKPKKVIKPSRPKHERKSKNYKDSFKLIDKSKKYSISEALDLVSKTSRAKFDATVEMHFRLNLDPKQADQNIRDSFVLPSGTGKQIKVAVFTDENDIEKAKKAGADIAGSDSFLEQLDKSIIDFDVLIATPEVMSKLAKYARILGPKGLMPSPKSNTVTTNVEKAVKEAKAGRVEYRVDSAGIVHLGIGKVSFTKEQLKANADSVIASIKSAKPQSIKGTYVKSIYLTTTMGPSIPVDISEI